MAHIVSRALREIDFLARFGGEELVVMMKNTPYEDAMNKTEQLRELIESHAFRFGATELTVTASFGVCTLEEARFATPQEMLVEADSRMYKAKQAGKNAVTGRYE